MREAADKIFGDLPPPKPSRACGHTQFRAVSMASYNRRSAPCFSGESLALLADGSLSRVDDLKKGDVVQTEVGAGSKVVCILKTEIPGRELELVGLGGLRITPNHPVFVRGSWVHPKTLQRPKLQHCEA